MHDLISIIIPIYNADKYLERCLNSLISQTYTNIEIICINDGSTDNSREILDKYKLIDSKIKVIHQKNAGPAVARNVGLDHASGEYLMFCDADDWYERDMCEIMLQTMKKEDTDFIRCGTFINEEIYNKMGRDKIRYINKSSALCGNLLLNSDNRSSVDTNLWNKMFKKNIVDLLHIRFPNGYEHDDTSFIFQYICASDSCFLLTKKLYHHTIRENSVMDRTYSKRSIRKKFDNMHSMKFFLDFVIKNSLLVQNSKFIIFQIYTRMRFFDWLFLSNNAEKFLELKYCQNLLKNIGAKLIYRDGNFLTFLVYLGFFRIVQLYIDNNPIIFFFFQLLVSIGKLLRFINPFTFFDRINVYSKKLSTMQNEIKNILNSLSQKL